MSWANQPRFSQGTRRREQSIPLRFGFCVVRILCEICDFNFGIYAEDSLLLTLVSRLLETPMSAISQSIAWWCFVPEKLTPEQFVRAVADAGFAAVELVPPEYWSLVKDHGLAISAIAAHQPLTIGLNRRDLHDRLEDEIHASIANAQRL